MLKERSMPLLLFFVFVWGGEWAGVFVLFMCGCRPRCAGLLVLFTVMGYDFFLSCRMKILCLP